MVRDDLLTLEERVAMAMTVALVDQFGKICGRGPSREGDMAEFVTWIHAIQHTIMAQAAARAYPGEFRLLGEVISREDPPPGD
jgi:hypothetical protein